MNFTAENVKKLLKAVLNYKATKDDDFLIDLAVEATTDYVKRYCHLCRLPKSLNTQLLYMAMGEFLYQKKQFGGLEGLGIDLIQTIASITEGDTSTSFTNDPDSSHAAALDKYIDEMRWGNRLILQEYRILC